VFDIDLSGDGGVVLPKGFKAERYDLVIHGRCPACANGQK
jgi:Fe2+ or Zn2+ uptake regulation protein